MLYMYVTMPRMRLTIKSPNQDVCCACQYTIWWQRLELYLRFCRRQNFSGLVQQVKYIVGNTRGDQEVACLPSSREIRP